VGRSIDWDEIDVGDVPPEVARMLGRGRSERVLARAMMAVAWIALSVVLLSFVVSLVRALAR
jgi:hypothetical protein